MGELKQKELQSKIDILRRHNLLENFSLSILRSLCFCTTVVSKRLKEVIFDFNSPVTGFYLLSEGEVAIYAKTTIIEAPKDTEILSTVSNNQNHLRAPKPRSCILKTRVVQDPNVLLEEYFGEQLPMFASYRAVVVSDKCKLLYIPFDLMKKSFAGSQYELDAFSLRCLQKRQHYNPTPGQERVLRKRTEESKLVQKVEAGEIGKPKTDPTSAQTRQYFRKVRTLPAEDNEQK